MNKAISVSLSQAITIEILTIAWMIVEGAVSIYAGVVARSLSLVAFGVDSLIELISASFLLWRLQHQRRAISTVQVDRVEKKAAWGAAFALAALCVYVVIEAIYGLIERSLQEVSQVGIIISVMAIAAMLPLASKKRALATVLRSSALRADAACSITCAYMAGALLIGLGLNALTGWQWVDSVVSLVFLFWLIPETKEAFDGARHGELTCSCD